MQATTHNRSGVLMYGNRVVSPPQPFGILGKIQMDLIAEGYDRSLFHKHYKPRATMQSAPQINTPAPVPMPDTKDFPDLSEYFPRNNEWFYSYLSTMGETALYAYRDKVYALLDKLQTGQMLAIHKWCKPENYDLFIKVATCYITESKGRYRFENKYNIITNKYDAREMEELTRICQQIKQRRQNAGTNSDTATS